MVILSQINLKMRSKGKGKLKGGLHYEISYFLAVAKVSRVQDGTKKAVFCL